ncbi:MAG: hypothetical protein G3M70_11625 [Candidatus Nitronauta litoralis]|uniref:Uncharacterized protein n=1 Tax=Candidatus Nitronauta litoralis TaxID=2705533 RepID=A0A7T0BX23_9BACT|nr:MAG: hypothetical protein G3M70_11625 [Candidatus Nitronauta litoralis]
MKNILKKLKIKKITLVVMAVLIILVSKAYADNNQGAKKEKISDNLTPKESILKNMETIGDYFDEINDRLPILSGSSLEKNKNGKTSTEAEKKPQRKKVVNSNPVVLERPSGQGSGVQRTAGYFNGKRDPFAVTNRLLKVRLGQGEGALSFQPAKPGANFPVMKLRGIVRRPGKKIAALLEVEGAGTHVVREEDTVGLNELGKDAVVRIKKINRLNLVVEVGSLGQVMIVR